MPRRPRIHLDGVPLHIVQRGHNRQSYFFDACLAPLITSTPFEGFSTASLGVLASPQMPQNQGET